MTPMVRSLLRRFRVRAFGDSDIHEAQTENVKFDAAKLGQAADRLSQSATRLAASNSRLRESIRKANLKPFAELEILIHHGERRSVHGNH